VSASFRPGTRLGRWEITGELGRGGMGVVYRARDPATGVEAALKVTTPEMRSDARALERFSREIAAARSVVQGNVVAVLDSGLADDGSPFVALELVEGGSLARRIERTGPLPPAEVVAIGVGIARALAAIHAVGLVHRDLKPANVLVGDEGEPKVADFGLARNGASSALTRTGELVGTLDYMAPEQMDRAREVDGRADLYALGATLWALLVGRPPFEGQGAELLKRVVLESPRTPGRLVPGVPRELDELVLELMAKEPEGRPATAAEVATRLERIAARPARARRGPWPIVAAVFGVGIVAGGGGAWWAARRAPPPPPPDVKIPEDTPKVSQREPAAERKATGPVKELRRLEHAVAVMPHLVWEIACSPTETGVVAIVSWNDGGWVYDLNGPEPKMRWGPVAGRQVLCTAFSRDGAKVAFGSDGLHGEASIEVFDAASGRSLRRLVGHGDVPLPAAQQDQDPKEVASRESRKAVVESVLFLEDGRVASGGFDGTLRLWPAAGDAAPLKPHESERDPWAHLGRVECIAQARRDGPLVSGGAGAKATIWDAATGSWVRSFQPDGPMSGTYSTVNRVAVSSDDTVLVGMKSGRITAWSATTEPRDIREPPEEGKENHAIIGLAFIDERFAVSASRDGLLQLWEPAKKDRPELRTIKLPLEEAYDLAVQGDVVWVSGKGPNGQTIERYKVVR
jgi:hypothetical protein